MARWEKTELVTGTPLPPEKLRSNVGSQDAKEFQQVGDEFVWYLRRFCNLQPNSRVLDIGCGCGRMAIPLLGEIKAGSYVGVDVSSSAIEWCKHYISYPNFEFKRADLKNATYNPEGTVEPAGYSFPDGPFDIALLASVFTHLLPNAVYRYIREIRRTLSQNGYALATAFLLTAEDRRNISTSKVNLDYRPTDKPFWAYSQREPEQAIAFDFATLFQQFTDAGLVVDSVKWGDWIQRACETLSFQDILILRRADNDTPI